MKIKKKNNKIKNEDQYKGIVGSNIMKKKTLAIFLKNRLRQSRRIAIICLLT